MVRTNTKHNSAVYIQIAAYCVQCNHIHYCSHMHVTYCEHVCYKVIAQDESNTINHSVECSHATVLLDPPTTLYTICCYLYVYKQNCVLC